MTQFTSVFQFTATILVSLVLKSAHVDSTEDSSCSFPPGSIACKAWNYTNMDCSWRELACVPQLRNNASLELLDLSNNELTDLPEGVFSGFIKLHTLDLSSNGFSTLNVDTFSVLPNLQSLDLSYNFPMSSVNGTFTGLGKLKRLVLSSSQRHLNFTSVSPFQYLVSLQTLLLVATISRSGVTVTPATFAGLNHTLQVLHIFIDDMTTDTPFVQLSSLQYLELAITTCNHVNENLFVGLDKLKYLKLEPLQLGCIIKFSPLVSLTVFKYSNDNTAFDIDTKIKNLDSLNSSLQSLELWSSVTPVRVNSTTLESLSKWRKSLQELTLYCSLTYGNLQIEGFPFQWFPQLQRLRILGVQGEPTTTSWRDPKNTFEGLVNLKEVRLNGIGITDSIASLVLNTTAMHSVKVLDLASNKIDTYDGLEEIRDLTTLETIDLTDSMNKDPTFDHIIVFDIFYNKPNLTALNVTDLRWTPGGFPDANTSIEFPSLVSFHSSNSEICIDSRYYMTHIHGPRLEELFLGGITFWDFNSGMIKSIKVLTLFEVPQLKILDLSSNRLDRIDEEDTLRLINVTHLDLRDNMFTSISSLSNLNNIEVLLLGGNKITSVPNSFLSSNPLKGLDLHDNPFVCDCRIERFQKWVLTDDVTHLFNTYSNANRYKCVASKSRYSITEINLDCEVPLLIYISVSVSCGLVSFIAAILAVRYRWHIQYRLFLLFNRRAYQNYLINDDDVDDDFEDEDGVPRYDAYVIYHNQDEDWVDEKLLANIEEDHEEPFRLCLKNRDIRAGRLIFNELSLHIRRSRKTLVILTPRFVEDNWCYFQLNMAHHRVLEENHNVLIFIILEEIPDKRLTLLLRQLFCKSQCLKWPKDEYGQKLFWQRLREELKRPVPRDQIHRYRHYNI